MDYADVTKPESSDFNNKLSTEISMRPYYHLYLKKKQPFVLADAGCSVATEINVKTSLLFLFLSISLLYF